MRKAALMMVLAAVSAAALPVGLKAQTANGSVSATAIVEANLTVSVAENLHFGSIQPTMGSTVSPGGPPAGAGQTLGALQVDHNSDVSVSAVVPATLTHTGGSTLPVTFSCGYSASATGALIGAAAACNTLPDVAHPDDGTPVTTFLQVGGSINGADTAAAVPGTYTGNVVFTLTAQY